MSPDHPTPEIVKQGNAAILSYFEELERQGIDSLYEAKMLVIGEGGAGKTSLVRKLQDEQATSPQKKKVPMASIFRAWSSLWTMAEISR